MNIDTTPTLNIFGKDLQFDTGVIKGIVQIDLTILSGEHTVYTVEKQNFMFQVDTKQIAWLEITTETQFSLSDGTYFYTFVLNRPPVPDLMGWSILYTDFVSKQLI